MKILITGAKGQLAKSLSLYLKKNYEIFSLDKNELDITDLSNIEKNISKLKPNIIINTAAYTKVDLAETNYQIAHQINSIGPKNLSKVIKNMNIYLIHISTDFVFDGNKSGEYNENDKTNPISVYGKTKLIGEEEIIYHLKNYMIFRVSWLYGPASNNFIFKIIDQIKKNNKLTVVNDQFGRPTSTLDLSILISQAIKKISNNNFKNGLYHYSDGGAVVSRYKIAEYIVNNLTNTNFLASEIIPTSSNDINLPAKRLYNSSLSLNKTLKEFKVKETNWENSILKVLRDLENAY